MQTSKRPRILNQFGISFILLYLMGASLSHAGDWIYKVKHGDNLWNLTIDYLVDFSYVKRVQKLNKISNPNYILPGR